MRCLLWPIKLGLKVFNSQLKKEIKQHHNSYVKGLNSKPSKSEKPPKVLPVGQGCHTTYLGKLDVLIVE